MVVSRNSGPFQFVDQFKGTVLQPFFNASVKTANTFNTWGQQTFASSFARRGIAGSMFAGSPGAGALNAFKPTLPYGGAGHMRNLRELSQRYPESKGVKKAIEKARLGSPGMGKFGMAMSGAFAIAGAAYVAEPLFATKGSVSEKMYNTGERVASVMGSRVGWAAGAAIGTAVGALVGSAIPVVGTAVGALVGKGIGALAGGIAGGALFESSYNIPQRMVDRERSRRNLNWRNDQTAFMTQSAHTMRQQSLQAMNRGMVTARSMLGREGVMLHQ